ncbi:dnaJ homolog subfamily C member 30, mitochondrial-like [Betta splendens]|uniref:DnaJ homolog subfamily C member 30, mitochondrial n=1 Tax=Betta splendens TaxID=158456 RepID=A0A6P7LJ44_BETSP|nr:dnaJ homolog subfamily C member 30, mitochondrial-like [Betta splendens]
MAEVRLCFGRRVCHFAHKTRNRNLLGSQKKLSKYAREASRLSVGFLLGDTQYNRLYGAEDAADALTAELCQRVDAGGPSRCDSVTFKTHSLLAANRWGTSPSPRLFWRHAWIDQNVRAYSGNGTGAEPLYKSKTGYYEVLEVPPTATQAQIKTAYYKQSFIYHPDRNSGSDQATTRFSEISEAYTVLGSKALRKKYDRGLLCLSDLTAANRPSGRDSTGGPVRQPGGSGSVAGQHVRRGSFDFDTFYKSHYSEQLQRERDIRVRKEEMMKRKKKSMA